MSNNHSGVVERKSGATEANAKLAYLSLCPKGLHDSDRVTFSSILFDKIAGMSTQYIHIVEVYLSYRLSSIADLPGRYRPRTYYTE